MISLWTCFQRQFKREMLLRLREPRLILNALLFFLMMLFFFPMSLSTTPQQLHEIAPGLIWIATLFSALLSSEHLFQAAFDEGVWAQAYLSGFPLACGVSASLLVHLSVILIPIFFICPFVAMLFAFTPLEVGRLVLSLLCGAPAMFGLTALSGALGVGRLQKDILSALLVLPLTVPLLIFGSGVMHQDSAAAISGMLALLLACSLLVQGMLPWAIAAILRLRLGDG